MSLPLHEKKALSRDEVAELYSVSVDVIRRAINAGTLRAKKNGNRYVVSAEAAAAWFEQLDDA